MSLFPLNRGRPVISGPVFIPPVPTLVFAEMYAVKTPIHTVRRGDMTTWCGLQLWPFWTVEFAKIRRLSPQFCASCWPGRRCRRCGMPSGESTECEPCTIASIDTDKAFERSAA